MKFEACAHEDGHFLIVDGKREILRLPIVTAHEGATVCEFQRVGTATLPIGTIVDLLRSALLDVFLGHAYREPVLELVDLDEQRWARVPYTAVADHAIEWTAFATSLPPTIATRATAISAAPGPAGLPLLTSVDGFRFAWTAACASSDGQFVATAHGKTGTVWITERATGRVRKLAAIGAQVHSMSWGHALVAIAVKVPHCYVLAGDVWQTRDLGTGAKLHAAWSPTASELAFACLDGHLRIYDAELRCRLDVVLADEAPIYDVRWSADGQRLFVGHSAPRVTVHRADTGAQLDELTGTQHFQQRFLVGPEDRFASSLRMKHITLYERAQVVGELPNPAAHGLTHGGFARRGQLIVTECNEGLVRVWRWHDRALLQSHAIGKEPIVVLDDGIVIRDPATKRLELRALPSSQQR